MRLSWPCFEKSWRFAAVRQLPRSRRHVTVSDLWPCCQLRLAQALREELRSMGLVKLEARNRVEQKKLWDSLFLGTPEKKARCQKHTAFTAAVATSIIPSLGQTLFCQASSLNSAKIHRSRNLREQKDMIPKQTCLLFTWVKDIFLPLLICHGRWQNKTAKMILLSGKLKHCQTNFGCSFLKGASSGQWDGSSGQTVAFAFHSTTLISTLLSTGLEIDGC